MALPNQFNNTSSPVTINYTATDILSNQGTVEYYLALFTNSTTTSKALVREGTAGNPLLLTFAGNNVASAQRYDYDFDTTFKTPQIINGRLIINATTFAIGTGGGQTGQAFIIVNVYKVNGATETLLGTQTSATVSSNTAAYVYDRVAMQVELPRTPMAIGEKLRVSLELWTAHVGVGNTSAGVYLDPLNQKKDPTGTTTTTYDTDFVIFTPFQLILG